MFKSFVSHFEMSSLLKEGGNVRVHTSSGNFVQADKIDLNTFSRTDLVHKLLDFFHNLNLKFQTIAKKPLWPLSEDINNGHIFNGSSEHFFNLNISDDDFKKHKPRVGDIDVTVPDENKELLFAFLKKIEGKKITSDISFIGSKQDIVGEGHQINSLIRINKQLNIQIDFEFSSYKDNKPSSFAKFSHSSDWEDIKQGFKGVLHKYLLQSIVSISDIKREDEAVLLTPASTYDNIKVSKRFPEKGLTFKKFSVGRGLRANAYTTIIGPDGQTLRINNKIAYKEKPTAESTYIQEPLEIAKQIFGSEFLPSEMRKFNSFVGLIELCTRHFNIKTKQDLVLDFVRRLFNIGSQGFERDNPQADFIAKRAGFNYIKTELNINSLPYLPETLEELFSLQENNNFFKKVCEYYKNYGSRKSKQ